NFCSHQPSSKHGERTPLRSLDNEILHFSTPSSELKKLSSEAAKMSMVSLFFFHLKIFILIYLSHTNHLCHQQASFSPFGPEFQLNSPVFTKMTQSSPPHVDWSTSDCGPEEVTFKSFMCDGGEVEIPESTVCHQASIILPTDVDTCCSRTEDTIPCPSVMEQYCCDHAEHPYYNPNIHQACAVDIGSPRLGETSAQASLDATSDGLPYTGSEDHHITLKSFDCHGGEVEVSDATKLQDETIPLPTELDSLEDNSTEIANFSDFSHLCQEEHADHPYCINDKCPLIATFSETITVFEQPGSKATELPSNRLTCHEDEIQISVDEKSFLHLPAVSSKKPSNDDLAPSVLAAEHDLQSDHLDSSISLLKASEQIAKDKNLADDSVLEGDKSLFAASGLCTEHLESPMPSPLFNSTVVCHKFSPRSATVQEGDSGKQSCVEPQPEVKQHGEEIPLIPEGQLQQQLRQMAEFLILACGKIGPAVSTSAPPPFESLSVCVGTSPVKLVDCSLNTSGLFERRREFSVADSCTLTDPLLWNLPPGSLESLPRRELEQRLTSSTIMIEALVQQLAAARAHGGVCAGAAPSDLREKLVQTDHTELNQVRRRAFSAMEQLRRHCSAEISALEESVGSQQQLVAALRHTYPEQVHTHTHLHLHAVHLVSLSVNYLNNLNFEFFLKNMFFLCPKMFFSKTLLQMAEELEEARVNLQAAGQQIGDLSLQETILTSEMEVLRQKLTEEEEEKTQLDRKVTELSATISSTLASYAFLEQSLAAETAKYVCISVKNRLEASLGDSERRVRQLSQALAHSEEQLGQLQSLSQSQSCQIQQLQDACAQLSSVREMNEFLQMENELAREQVVESERLLRTNMQSLRERNIQCEDLKGEVGKLQDVAELRRSLQESRVEGQFLREELKRAGGQSSYPAHYMEEKIQLLKEVERMKVRLQEADQARAKLLERAKRHVSSTFWIIFSLCICHLVFIYLFISFLQTLLSLPDVVQKCDQLQQLVEYIG
uniref:Sperm associated antigen 5 n=1 Tax=Oryzias latipes TaxID=8090 RepID=A0A3B3I0A1_ORYLA